jgi:hypothetical protein
MNMDMADVKPSIISWIIVGLMATTFIVAGKYAATKFNIPGFSPLMRAA